MEQDMMTQMELMKIQLEAQIKGYEATGDNTNDNPNYVYALGQYDAIQQCMSMHASCELQDKMHDVMEAVSELRALSTDYLSDTELYQLGEMLTATENVPDTPSDNGNGMVMTP